MALDHDKQNEILIRITELKFQVDRLVSDAESEKEFRKQRNREIEDRLKVLETWKAELHGRIVVTVAIATLIWGALVAVVLKLIK